LASIDAGPNARTGLSLIRAACEIFTSPWHSGRKILFDPQWRTAANAKQSDAEALLAELGLPADARIIGASDASGRRNSSKDLIWARIF